MSDLPPLVRIACVLSSFSCVRLLATFWTVIHQAPSSVHGTLQARILRVDCHAFLQEISRPGIEPGSPALPADSFTTVPPGKP